MALGRLGAPGDEDCVLVTAEENGVLRAMLALRAVGQRRPVARPDAARQDRAGRAERLPDRGGHQGRARRSASSGCRSTSRCSAPRSSAASGSAPGPVLRAWRGLLVFVSRWFQIESLYKFNAKFSPGVGAALLRLPRRPGRAAHRVRRPRGRGVPGLAQARGRAVRQARGPRPGSWQAPAPPAKPGARARGTRPQARPRRCAYVGVAAAALEHGRDWLTMPVMVNLPGLAGAPPAGPVPGDGRRQRHARLVLRRRAVVRRRAPRSPTASS